ncbi:MAG TPA: glutamate--tRNA ligase [Candidatus Thermoplasmatota archaeon]|nr:glutamate--tRNA ligase [Candidatus Thermoplasmatota archaeon]
MAEPASSFPPVVREAARRFALQNAAAHGQPDPGAVMGKIMAEFPELRPRAKEVSALVREVVAGLAPLSQADARATLEKEAPELLVRERKERDLSLPDLLGAQEGKVVMRLAPYPSGPLHVGNARMAVLNDEYVKRYKGRLLLVYDDTIGSEEKLPVLEAYDLIRQGLEWLGVRIDGVAYKSERMEIFYTWAVRLLKTHGAYVCECGAAELRENRERGLECAHRGRTVEENLDLFAKMLAGGFREGEAIVRLRTDMRAPDPAFRDRVLLRISERPHPRAGTRYRVWPMLEFSWAVDDHLLGITHVLRGKDLVIEDRMEAAIWQKLGVSGPAFGHFGMLRVADAKISKSKSMAEVRSGQYTGWDDPRTWSLQSLSSRGIEPEAVRRFVLSFGLSMQDIEVPAENLYAENRRLLEARANRYFFVADPMSIAIDGTPSSGLQASAPLHPDHPERGVRHHILPAPVKVYVPRADFLALRPGDRVRLKDLGNVECTKTGYQYVGNDLSVLKEGVRIVHWCPPYAIPGVVVYPDGARAEGMVERLAATEAGKVVQFERMGFARIRRSDGKQLEAYFAHR